MTDPWPAGVTSDDAPELDALADAGIGEGDFADDHTVPPHLLELHEAMEAAAAGLLPERTDSEREADENAWYGRHPEDDDR